MTLEDIEKRLIDARKQLLREIAPLQQEDLDIHMGGESWSIGEIIYHLAIAERQVARIIRSMARSARKQKDRKALPPEIDHTRSGPELDESSLNLPAAQTTEPEKGTPKQVLVDKLNESRKELGPCLTYARDLDLRADVYPHPYLGDLNAYQWLTVAAEHEEVHIIQIQKMLEFLAQK